LYELSSDVFNSTYKQLVILLETKMFLYAHCNMYLKSLKKNNIIWQSKRCVVFCRSLFVLLSFFQWAFFDLQLLIAFLISSNLMLNNTMITGKRTNNDLQITTQKTKDTKLVIRSCKSKDRQYNGHRKKDKHSTSYYQFGIFSFLCSVL
jgi:hypothetical protein